MLESRDVLLCGLAFTSRTETVEDYLKDKVSSLTVIALSSCFLKENLSACRIYEKGVLKKEFKVANFRIKDYQWYRQPLVLLVFVFNWFSIVSTVLKLRKKFHLCIGISHSFAFAGLVLKKMKRVQKLLYYCIDYYIPQQKLNFNSLFVKSINVIERVIVRNADFVWDLSEKIQEYRERLGRVRKGTYKSTVVPLGYSRKMRKSVPFEEINRWDIGFVGTVSANHGLEILVEAMPGILKTFPQACVKIIGQGPFLAELRELVRRKGLEPYFTFFGFIKEEDKMLDILSRCAVALALYTTRGNENIVCADTGKPKLYAFIGLPMVVTACYPQSSQIERSGVGIVINDEPVKMGAELTHALSRLLGSDEALRAFKKNAFEFGNSFVSDAAFDKGFSELTEKINGV